MKRVGLHLRLTTSLVQLIEQALRLQLPFFQCFLVDQSTRRYLPLKHDDVQTFLALRRQHFDTLFLHGSYWINLASAKIDALPMLKKELRLARKLEFTHIILHPGTATGCASKYEGIERLARGLNNVLKRERDITLVLENTAHGRRAIGSDLEDFKHLLDLLDYPDRVSFCIDTAHAYSFGYNIAQSSEQDAFISLLDSTLGKERIALIHLNDTKEELGKKIDRHHVPGHGNIGRGALCRLVHHDLLADIPLVMELPLLPEEEQACIVQEVVQWQSNKLLKKDEI